MDTGSAIRLSAIWIYPLKSAAGISVTEWRLDRCGLEEDRRFMLVDASGRFLSQRSHPKMALIRPEFVDGLLTFRFTGHNPLTIPRSPTWEGRCKVSVWDDQVWARTAPPHVSDWFRSVLGERHVTCVWFDPEVERRVDPAFAKPQDRVGFADGFPLLLTNETSLAELNRRLKVPTSMSRFRPNLVVNGARAFEEDQWGRVRIGTIRLRVSKPCARCQIPNVEPSTGLMEKEPMRTLATFRRIDGEVIFGQNLIHDTLGTVRVGESLTLY